MHASLGCGALSAKWTVGANILWYYLLPWPWHWTLQRPPLLKFPFLGSWILEEVQPDEAAFPLLCHMQPSSLENKVLGPLSAPSPDTPFQPHSAPLLHTPPNLLGQGPAPPPPPVLFHFNLSCHTLPRWLRLHPPLARLSPQRRKWRVSFLVLVKLSGIKVWPMLSQL